MRLIHNVVDDIRPMPDDEETPMRAAIEDLLGGERGSLQDLSARFTQGGLAHVLASWLGDGPPESIDPHMLRKVLGEARAEELATVAGLATGDFLVRLARVLPASVHREAADQSERTPASET